VTIEDQTYDYVSLLKGGFPTKEVWYLSTDGLAYTQMTSKHAEQLLNGRMVQAPLDTTASADNDWVQANTSGGMATLGGGGLLAAPDSGSEWALFDGRTDSWSSYRLPDGQEPDGLFQVGSAGRIHNVVPASGGDSFDYRVSADGGQTWKTTSVALPKGHTIEELDFRANRAAGVAAVAMRTQHGTGDQDLVYKLDLREDRSTLERLYDVGLGDADATGGVGNDVRFDFESVTIFPDGRVAVSFLDSTTGAKGDTAPAVAVEESTVLGGKVRTEPDVPPVLGQPYVTYTFDDGADGWSTAGLPTWSRSAPGVRDGADDPMTSAFALEGPTQYVDNVDATLTSAPILTPAGGTVLEFWLKLDTEPGFDLVSAQWSVDGKTWQQLGEYSGRNDGYPNWQCLTRLPRPAPKVPVSPTQEAVRGSGRRSWRCRLARAHFRALLTQLNVESNM
jgi:hypothetical protein